MSGIEGTNQPLSCRLRSYFEALGSMFVEKQTFVPVYSGNWWIQSSKGRSRIHQCAVPQWLVTTSMMTFSPFSWAAATKSR